MDEARAKRLTLIACILGSAIVFVDQTVVNVAQRRQRDVDDRLVDEHDRRAEDAGDERQPLRAGFIHRRETSVVSRKFVRS